MSFFLITDYSFFNYEVLVCCIIITSHLQYIDYNFSYHALEVIENLFCLFADLALSATTMIAKKIKKIRAN